MIINDKAFNVCVCETLRLFELINQCKGTYNMSYLGQPTT